MNKIEAAIGELDLVA